MWIRLRFDSSMRDLATGMLACCLPQDRARLVRQAEQYWSDSGEAVVCLSVRSGFDLLLSALRLPARSEILMSALTVPDMERIARHHTLMPVPVDLDKKSGMLSLDCLRRAVTPNTRVVMVAHLFGVRVDMGPIVEFARRHRLFVVEDCAQAFHGRAYQGHAETDAALFSFGPIKTATAFGGGVIRLKSTDVARQVRAIQQSYRVQSRRMYFARLAKYSVLKMLAARPLLSLIARGCRIVDRDIDTLIVGAARNFPTDDLLDHLRRQPSGPLVNTLLRRWNHYDTDRLERRMERGRLLGSLLEDRFLLNDQQAVLNNYWVFPVVADDQASVVARMRSLGFDATSRTRLTPVSAPADRPDLKPNNTVELLERIVFLPWYPEIPERVLVRMAAALNQFPARRARQQSTGVEALESVPLKAGAPGAG